MKSGRKMIKRAASYVLCLAMVLATINLSPFVLNAKANNIEKEHIEISDVIYPDKKGADVSFEDYLKDRLIRELPKGTNLINYSLSSDESYDYSFSKPVTYGNFGFSDAANFTDYQKSIYTFLRSEFEKIANGDSNGTTVIKYEFGDAPVYDMSVLGDLSGQAAAQAAWEMFNSDNNLNRVMNTLLHDCPYELYWFNKTEGVQMSAAFESMADGLAISSITFMFPVNEYYENGQYSFNNAKVTNVSDAIDSAKAIVEKYKNKSDYEKLKGYLTEICSLTEYNEEASGAISYGSDSNPWQMIYVFDGDPTTKVVCEGYAKAFQYLCDLTTFSTPVTSYIVTGKLGVPEDFERHMWNVVSIGGNNYLVDVTNCDGESIGNPDKLFLAGLDGNVFDGYVFERDELDYAIFWYDMDIISLYGRDILTLASEDYKPETHAHSGSKVNAVAATCEATGVKEYYICSCGNVYEDEDLTEEISDIEVWEAGDGKIPALGHSYGEPSYVWTGYSSSVATFTCSRDVQHVETVNGIITNSVTKEATTEAGGIRTYTATFTFNGRTYTDTKTEAIPKVIKETSTGDGEESGAGTGDESSSTEDEKDAKEEHVHVGTKINAVAATCENDGIKEYYTCSCGNAYEDKELTKAILDITAWKAGDGNVSALGHSYGEPAYAWTGYKTAVATFTCNRDAKHVETANGTITNAVTKEATSEAEGVRTYTATFAFGGKTYTDTKTESIPKVKVETKPEEGGDNGSGTGSGTGTEGGNGTTEAEHTHSATKVDVVDATCTATGTEEYYSCSCDKYFEDAECKTEIADLEAWKKDGGLVEKKDHEFGPAKITKATTSKNGSIVSKCANCDAEEKTTIYAAKTIKLSATEYTYDGKVKKPTVTVKDSKGNKIATSNYTVTYASGRKTVGEYKVTVKFKGNYTGSKALTFKIVPKTTSISKATPGSKKLTVAVKKYTTQTTGYEIQIATDKKFTKGVKKATLTKNTTTSTTFKSLKKGTVYYVRVRTYKTVGKTKFYSAWKQYSKTVRIK